MHSFLKLLSWLLGYGILMSMLMYESYYQMSFPEFSFDTILFSFDNLVQSSRVLLQDLRSNSQAFSRRLSFGSSISDSDRQTRFAEPAYSFVGMHCIFDNCKASGDF